MLDGTLRTTAAAALVLILGAAGCTAGPGPGIAPVAAGVAGDLEHPPLVTGDPTIEPWTFQGAEGTLITTAYFRIYTTLHRPDMLEALPGFYEACLRRYTTTFGDLPRPDRPLEAFIFSDGDQWQAKTREIIPDRADAFMSLGRGGLTTQGTSVLYDIGPRDTYAIAAHEGWHQYTQSTFKHPLPIWLEEGIAAWMEAIEPDDDGTSTLRAWNNRERLSALSRACRRDRLIPLEELLAKTPQGLLNNGKERLLVYYAQVWALTRFLSEGESGRYRPALEELLADAAAGRLVGRVVGPRNPVDRRQSVLAQMKSGPLLLEAYFNDDLEAIAREYEAYVRALAEPDEDVD